MGRSNDETRIATLRRVGAMTGRFAEIGRALADLQELYRDIASTVRGQADGWRHELVRLRRRAAEATGVLNALVHAGEPGCDTPQFDDFRTAVSRFRTAVAEHQGRWPAVLLDVSDPSYADSLTRLRGAQATMEETYRRLQSG